MSGRAEGCVPTLCLLLSLTSSCLLLKIATGEPLDRCRELFYTTPTCVNHPDGYGCECGPGSHWNTHMCMSTAVDSRLEFKTRKPVRYTLLLDKSFPELTNFTIVFWIRVSQPEHKGTIFSYQQGERKNVLRMFSGPTLQLEVWRDRNDTGIKLQPNKWHHIGITWSSEGGNWCFYLNGKRQLSGLGLGPRRKIPSGGEFVLGQSSRPNVEFQLDNAFLGDLAHFNIWSYAKTFQAIEKIWTDCTFMYCGNAVQWVEFRTGTRGAMRLRWPSGIARQKEKMKLNETLDYATRQCFRTKENDGTWGDPNVNDCISDSLMDIKRRIKKSLEGKSMKASSILMHADKLLNHTVNHRYENPVDIATVIDLLAILIKTQGITLRDVSWSHGTRTFSRTEASYPTFNHTKIFAEIIADIVNHLLDKKNDVAWNATRPVGTEGSALLQTMNKFSAVVSKSLEYHVKDEILVNKEAVIKVVRPTLAFKISSQWVEEFHGVTFPDFRDRREFGLLPKDGILELPSTVLQSYNLSGLPVFIGVSSFRYANMAWVVPNHDIRGKSKENHVNTPIVALYLHMDQENGDMENLTDPILLKLPFLDTFNISNPECVRMRHRNRSSHWGWSTSGCVLLEDRLKSGKCACAVPGVFAITTDMYNVNWDKGYKRPLLMNVASYVGSSISMLLSFLTFAGLTYLRTSTSTAHLHKNLACAISASQLTFMVGIDLYDYQIACQVFAVMIHYFVLASFAWIMNEAFNLYIMITYTAHSQGDHVPDSGSNLRYYILGWVIPGVLVGAFVGTQGELYYAHNMCWIAWGHLWLFIGPILGIIIVTILVLIFTAKEHNENSYTKSEKTNKVILIHCKSLWTQVILLTVCWAFAFLSVKMMDPIIKYLYAIVLCIQGSFFIVFFLLLHEEVRAAIQSSRKKKTLVMHGFDYTGDDNSMDSFGSFNVMFDKEIGENLPLEKQKLKPPGIRKKQRSRIEASSDEASDCEIMITSV
ncbi:LOW QUALITY PROTEIN: adhesion G protein-coupled receptor L2-like [Liolophura sinensis]|uniref:LOW QUALITY PROTEIN: adhesion G protein-coupled receptor L2-like n=1 Tax=Liolophura sinensis TaxID=3198878 RepID=UPI0031583BC1